MQAKSFRTRREALALIASSVRLPAIAQQVRVRRVGYLSLETAGSGSAVNQQRLLLEGLRRFGLSEPHNLRIEWRYAQGDASRLDALAGNLLRGGVDVIVAAFNHAIAAAARATRTVPVVMMGALVPVELGWAASLARPGGNLTGAIYIAPQTTGKLLQMLRQVMPGEARRVAVITNPAVPGAQHFTAIHDAAARSLGIALEFFGAQLPQEVDAALHRIAAWRPDALYISGDSAINPRSAAIAAFARERALPSIGTAQVHVREGALLHYGPLFGELVERVAFYTSRILAGDEAAQLPIEEPSRYELAINLDTARALGIQVPQELRLRADRFFGT